MANGLPLYGAAAVGLAVLRPLTILFIDQPVTLSWVHHQTLRPLFQACAARSLLTLPGTGLILLWALSRHLRGQPALDWLWLALATPVATAAKDELKWMIGRPWPWSWLKYSLYSFHPFAQSIRYGSFPSGHTGYSAAPLGVLWALRPRWRPLWAGLLLVMPGQVCADYHFLSDVPAGLLTGGFCAWGTLALMEQHCG
ncbi:phosphatase PAP2 family protein [Acidocella aminolytica]|nr:phosphatase PAP2 family protein [Acidocella aminolytica]GBQ39170.1 PA-phosphatase-like phosphoesterase [Acidocella aminolytica 101 = DSM 11237]SHF57948.1 PAP2 superfamily protein [Acidocella aminolytica 101 = DSM 11237]